MITRQMHNDTNITFRLPKQFKNQFIKKCEEQNLHYQTVIKQLMKDYINIPTKELEKQKHEQYLKTQRLL